MEEKNKRPYPKDSVYDGVIYTPSAAAAPRESQNAQAVRRKPAAHKTGTVRKKKKYKSQVGVFFAATLFTGIVVSIIVVALVFAPVLNSPPPAQPDESIKTPNSIPGEIVNITADDKKTDELTGIVKSAGQDGQLYIYDFGSGKTLDFVTNSSSSLKDKYGAFIVFAEISAGDIVDIICSGNIIKELIFSRQATDYKNISNVKIDPVEQTVEIGNETYKYNDNIISLHKGEAVDPAEIKPVDSVSVRFYQNTVWYLELVRGHGFIDIENGEQILDGSVEIDNNILEDLADFEKLEIAEGRHWFVVKGLNVEPLSQDVFVEHGQTQTVDLSGMQILKGQLTVQVNQKDYSVMIDDAEVDLNEPVILGYGEHSVTVEKEGFTPWTGKVNINKDRTALTVELAQKVQYCQLTLSSLPDGAEIYIDNFFVGVTPCTANIEYGTHALTYKKDGYKTIVYDITLDTETFRYTLVLQEDIPFMPYE